MDDKAEIKNIKVEFIQSIEINESKQMVKSSPAFSKDQKYEPKIINKGKTCLHFHIIFKRYLDIYLFYFTFYL